MPDKTDPRARGRAHRGASSKPTKSHRTRSQRRKAIDRIIRELEAIKTAEKRYLQNAPLNKQISYQYETAEQNVGILEEALAVLAEIFD